MGLCSLCARVPLWVVFSLSLLEKHRKAWSEDYETQQIKRETHGWFYYRFQGGINFDYINENPEVHNQGHGCYEHKPYGNIPLDDKAGFDPEEHWLEIYHTMKELPLLCP